MAGTWQLVSKTTGKTVVAQLTIAGTFWPRFVGWQFRSKPAADTGLLLVPCNSVHTCFVRFTLDVAFLDRNGVVLAVRRNLRPWRLAIGPAKCHAVLEFVAGEADVQAGEMLRLETPEKGTLPPKCVEFLVG